MKVFIGWDSREDIAYKVAKHSILKFSPKIEIIPLIKSDLISKGYFKDRDKLGSTEFTITRFLTPFLSGYKGFSLFMDCDMLVQTNIEKILDECNLNLAVNCVQHDYIPKTSIKMDGQTQFSYPRKNWSSVMVFNCSHPLIKKNLTMENVNKESPAYLHRMVWAEESIGSLSHSWNYLVGYYDDIEKPNILHYTDGGPWFFDYKNCDFAEVWLKEEKEVRRNNGAG